MKVLLTIMSSILIVACATSTMEEASNVQQKQSVKPSFTTVANIKSGTLIPIKDISIQKNGLFTAKTKSELRLADSQLSLPANSTIQGVCKHGKKTNSALILSINKNSKLAYEIQLADVNKQPILCNMKNEQLIEYVITLEDMKLSSAKANLK